MFQVNTVTDIEVVRRIVFDHARVMVIGVGSDLKSLTQPYTHYAQTTPIMHKPHPQRNTIRSAIADTFA